MNLQKSIRKILRESLESKWNEGNYDYQHGYCHYFAYNIIGKLKKLYPEKNIRYYLILAEEIYDFDEGEVEQSYLVHAYIKIDDLYLDSNGFSTEEEIEQRAKEWYERQLPKLPDDYRLEIWHDEYNNIPEYYFNNSFCNKKIIQQDITKFLSHPEVKELFNVNLQESIRKILREVNEEKKVNMIKKMIRALYPNVSSIEQSTFDNKPLLIIYFTSDDIAANIESWFDEKISRDVEGWFSGSIIVCPHWAFHWDERKKNADVYVDTELIKSDNSEKSAIRENSEEKMSNYITKYVNSLLINNKQYCGFEITPPSKNTEVYKYLDSDSKPYSATLYLIGGYDTKYWPRTQAIKDKEFNLVADITLNIKAMFSVTVMIRVEHVKSCDELNSLY